MPLYAMRGFLKIIKSSWLAVCMVSLFYTVLHCLVALNTVSPKSGHHLLKVAGSKH